MCLFCKRVIHGVIMKSYTRINTGSSDETVASAAAADVTDEATIDTTPVLTDESIGDGDFSTALLALTHATRIDAPDSQIHTSDDKPDSDTPDSDTLTPASPLIIESIQSSDRIASANLYLERENIIHSIGELRRTRTFSKFEKCCFFGISAALYLPALTAALNESAADVIGAREINKFYSPYLVYIAGPISFIAAIQLTGSTSANNIIELYKWARYKIYPESFPKLDRKRKAIVLTCSSVIVTWCVFSEAIQAYYFVNDLDKVYKITNDKTKIYWNTLATTTAVGVGLTKLLTDVYETIKMLCLIISLRIRLPSNVSSWLFGGFVFSLCASGAIADGLQSYASIKDIFGFENPIARAALGGANSINVLSTFCFAGLVILGQFDELTNYLHRCLGGKGILVYAKENATDEERKAIWRAATQNPDFEPEQFDTFEQECRALKQAATKRPRFAPAAYLSFSIATGMALCLSFAKRPLTVFNTESLASDDFNLPPETTPDYLFESLAWVIFLYQVMLVIASLNPQMMDIFGWIADKLASICRCLAFCSGSMLETLSSTATNHTVDLESHTDEEAQRLVTTSVNVEEPDNNASTNPTTFFARRAPCDQPASTSRFLPSSCTIM